MESPLSASPPLRSNYDPIWREAGLRDEPSWWDYFRRHFDRDRFIEQPGPRRVYFLNATQIGRFALYLPPGFEFFAGQQVSMGLTQFSALAADTADRLTTALACNGVQVPGASTRFRAVGRKGCVFIVVEPVEGSEPSLPADWLTTWEVAGEQCHMPWWIGERRRASQLHDEKILHPTDTRCKPIDWSLYDRCAYGWKLRDSPPLPATFSGPMT